MVPGVHRRLLYAVTVLFLISLIAPTVRLTSAQDEATPATVQEVAPEPTDSPPPPEPTVAPTDPQVTPTETTVVEGPTLQPVDPTTVPSTEIPPTVMPTDEPATETPAPTAAPTSEPAEPPTPASDAVNNEPTRQQQSQERIATAIPEPTLRFEVTTNDGGNPEGIWIDLQVGGDTPSPSVEIDANGSATLSLPFGSYSFSTFDPNGIYHQVIDSFDFTTDGQVVSIALETTLQHGSATFVATTSDGGTATQNWVYVESLDQIASYPSKSFGEDNTVTIPRLPYGLYSYIIPASGVYSEVTGQFYVDDPLETVNVSISALPNGTISFDGSTSDGGSAQGAYVELLDPNGFWVADGYLDGGHDITFNQILYGNYTYVVYPFDIYERHEGTITVDSPSVSGTFTLQAKPLSTLTVNVTTSDGGSPSGASINLVDSNGYNVGWGSVDENNQVVMERLIQGEYTWTIPQWDIYAEVSGPVSLTSPDVTLDVTLQAQPYGSVSFDGSTDDGLPAEGAYLSLRTADGSYVGGVSLDENLDAVLDRIPYGNYTYYAGDAYNVYPQITGSFTLNAADLTVNFELVAVPSGVITLDGTTSDAGNPGNVWYSIRNVGWTWSQGGSLDSSGDATLPRLPLDDYVLSITDNHGRYEPVEMTFTLAQDTLTVPFELVALPDGTLTVTVREIGTDSPIAGASIVITDSETGAEVATGWTGDDGTFSTPDSLAAGYYTIYVSRFGYYPTSDWVQVAGDTSKTVYLEAHVPGTLTVTVVESDTKSPIADATITVRDSEGTEVANGTTGTDGTFTTASLPGGNYSFDVTRENYVPWLSQPVTIRGDASTTVGLEARFPGTLTVQVLDQSNSVPIEGANVTVSYWDEASYGTIIVATGTTGADGTYTTGTLIGGYYSVDVTAGGYFSGWTYPRVNGDTAATVELEPRVPGTLTVEVLEQGSDPVVPIVGASVVVRNDTSWDIVATGTTGDDGGFTTATLEAGTYYIEVAQENYYSNGTWVRVNSDTSTSVSMEPRVPGTLTVNVLEWDTDPAFQVEGATVTVSYWDETSSETIVAATGTTDTVGLFTTSSLEGRDYSIQVEADGYYGGVTMVRVNGDTNTTVYLEPRISGTLTVEVVEQESDPAAPIADVSVVVWDTETWTVVATGTTGANGTFTTSSLPGGTYAVDLTKDGYYPLLDSWVQISGDETLALSLEPRIPGTLTVTVLQSNTDPAAPVDDATVNVTYWDEATHQYVTVATGTTDSDGRFVTEQIDGGDYSIDVTRDGYFRNSTGVHLSGDTSTTVHLQPRISGTLTVTVVQPGTTVPVSDAAVTIRSQETGEVVETGTTSTDGQFVTSAPLPGGYYDVLVEKDTYYTNSSVAFVNGDISIGIELTPRIPGTITITVLDENTGDPIPNAEVWASSWDARSGEIGTTNADGIFTTSQLPGGQYDVFASADEYYTRVANTTVSGDTTVTVSLPPRIDGMLTVHVTDQVTGDPIEGASVSLQSHDTWLVDPVGTTGPDGSYSAPLAAGSYYIVVTADGYFGIDEWHVFIDGDTTQDIALVPKVAGSLTVIATHAETGDPIPGASVRIANVDEPWQIIGTTDENGAFTTFDVVDGGHYRIVVEADGYFAYQGEKAGYYVVDGDTEFTVPMYPAISGELTFTISDGLSGVPLHNASILMTSDDGGASIDGSTGADGTFTTNEALPGELYNVSITADGYYPHEWDRWFIDGSDRELHLWLQPKLVAELHLTVLHDVTFEPIEGATVTVWSGDDPYGDALLTGSTDAGGVFRSVELPADRVWYQIKADGFITTGIYSYLPWDSVLENTYFLIPAGELHTGTIIVQDALTGEPIPGADVSLWDRRKDAGYNLHKGLTGAAGQAVIPGLPPGLYRVSVNVEGYEDTYENFTALEINLWDGDATLVVELFPLSYVPDAQVALVIQPDVDGTYVLTSPGGDQFDGSIVGGLADIGTVPYGHDYTLTIVGNGYEPVTRSIDVQADEIVIQTTLTTLATPTAEPSVTPVTPSPSPSATVVPSETPATPSPSPSVTPSTTPSETPVTPNPSPSTTPVTPDPSPSVTPSTTPVETTTPTASETPVTPSPSPSTTPGTPSPSPSVTPQPSPSVTPSVTPEQTVTPDATVTPTPTEQAPLETSFTLCANEECAPPHNTGADGFTASWTVTEQTDTATLVEQLEIASVSGGSGSVSLSALQQDAPRTWIITAVIQNGVATGFSEPLPLGGYRVCLDPVLTGPDGSTIVLPNVPPCDAVQLTEEGPIVDGESDEAGEPVPFNAVIIGAPEVIPPAQQPPDEDNEPSPTPTAPAPEAETPVSEEPPVTTIPDDTEATETPASSASGGVSGLPNTGTGAATSPIAAWMLAASAAALLAGALGLRQRDRR